MAVKGSETRYDKGGRELYLTYETQRKARSGDVRTRSRAKRFYVPADSKDVKVSKPSMLRKRTGREAYGVEVRYAHRVASATAQRGTKRYRVAERWSERSKVIELPEAAKNVKLTDKPPKNLVAVA